MKFKEYDFNNPPKETCYGVDFTNIPTSIVNADLKDIQDGDIFIPKGENEPESVFNKFDYKYLIARPWGKNGDFIFKLYTNNPLHFYTEEDLKNEFINLRK